MNPTFNFSIFWKETELQISSFFRRTASTSHFVFILYLSSMCLNSLNLNEKEGKENLDEHFRSEDFRQSGYFLCVFQLFPIIRSTLGELREYPSLLVEWWWCWSLWSLWSEKPCSKGCSSPDRILETPTKFYVAHEMFLKSLLQLIASEQSSRDSHVSYESHCFLESLVDVSYWVQLRLGKHQPSNSMQPSAGTIILLGFHCHASTRSLWKTIQDLPL